MSEEKKHCPDCLGSGMAWVQFGCHEYEAKDCSTCLGKGWIHGFAEKVLDVRGYTCGIVPHFDSQWRHRLKTQLIELGWHEVRAKSIVDSLVEVETLRNWATKNGVEILEDEDE